MYIIHCTCMFTAERKLEQWRHSFDKVGAVHSPSARSAIIDIFITIIIIDIRVRAGTRERVERERKREPDTQKRRTTPRTVSTNNEGTSETIMLRRVTWSILSRS